MNNAQTHTPTGNYNEQYTDSQVTNRRTDNYKEQHKYTHGTL